MDNYLGRFYGNWRPVKYKCPIDSVKAQFLLHSTTNATNKEELYRLDIFYTVFLIARGGCTYIYTLGSDPPPKILDLGIGTGIWPINIAER